MTPSHRTNPVWPVLIAAVASMMVAAYVALTLEQAPDAVDPGRYDRFQAHAES